MGQPTPPGDIPLVEGLDASWNEFVSYIPEDKRAEFAPKFKERISSYEELKGWQDFQKSGITPENAKTAMDVFATLENNPRMVYDTIGSHLGITPKQAEKLVEEVEEAEASGDAKVIAEMQQKIDTMSQIMLANHQQATQAQRDAQAEAELDSELKAVRKKYGDDVPEEEIVMRMVHKGMSAEDAYKEAAGFISNVRKSRPAPYIMGSGGMVPSNAIDPRKLSSADTKSLVTQMMQAANAEARK